MNFETLKLRPEGNVLRVSLAASPINLMSPQMVGELFTVAGGLISDQNTRVVVLDSDLDEYFMAHFDLLAIIASVNDPESPQSQYPDINILQGLITTWQSVPQVTVAKVNGICRGAGLELILGLDMRFASADSTFGFPEASGGFLACGGGTTRVLMSCGPARGLEVLLSSRDFTGDEAERYGLVNRALPASELNTYVEDTVAHLAKRPLRIVALHKQVLRSVFKDMADAMFAGFGAENDGLRASLSRDDVLAVTRRVADEAQTPETEKDLPALISRITSEIPLR